MVRIALFLMQALVYSARYALDSAAKPNAGNSSKIVKPNNDSYVLL